MNKQDKLKPCPFCGGEVRLEDAYITYVSIKCDDCKLEKDTFTTVSVNREQCKINAITAWNTRATDHKPTNRLDQIQQMGAEELAKWACDWEMYKCDKYCAFKWNDFNCNEYECEEGLRQYLLQPLKGGEDDN